MKPHILSELLLLLLFFICSSCQKTTSKKILFDLKHPQVNQRAPEKFKVEFHTSKGLFIVAATRKWAPKGVDR